MLLFPSGLLPPHLSLIQPKRPPITNRDTKSHLPCGLDIAADHRVRELKLRWRPIKHQPKCFKGVCQPPKGGLPAHPQPVSEPAECAENILLGPSGQEWAHRCSKSQQDRSLVTDRFGSSLVHTSGTQWEIWRCHPPATVHTPTWSGAARITFIDIPGGANPAQAAPLRENFSAGVQINKLQEISTLW